MKCAAAIIFVCIAFVSQALAVLRPLFPAKAGPPFNHGTITTETDSIEILQSNLLVQRRE
jgi:hypothetical protein